MERKGANKPLNMLILRGSIIVVVVSVLLFALVIYFFNLVVCKIKTFEWYSNEYWISFDRNLTIIFVISFIVIILIMKNIILDSIRIISYYIHENEILKFGQREKGTIIGFKCDLGRSMESISIV